MRGEMLFCSYNTYNHNDFGLLVTKDIGEYDFINCSIVGMNQACTEKYGCVGRWCGVINTQAEAPD